MTRKTVITLLFILAIVCGGFFYLVSNPPSKTSALKSLAQSQNVDMVHALWDKHQEELGNHDDFVLAIKEKLISFNLSKTELNDCKTWLPEPPTSFNLIIVPDLSNRIIDIQNNPHQIERDRTILRAIWKSFVAHTKLKSNSKDHIMITIADRRQANGQFDKVADGLICDLSANTKGVNRLFFTPYRQSKFYKNIDKLYDLAEPHPSDADFFQFFESRLPSLLKSSDLFHQYDNKLIILTDGYITPKNQLTQKRINHWLANNQVDFNAQKLQTRMHQTLQKQAKISHAYSELDVLVCEVNAETESSLYHQTALHSYWQLWLENMSIKSPIILDRDYATSETTKTIDAFIGDH